MLTGYSTTSQTTITATAILVLRQVDHTLALHLRPPTTLAVNTAAALRATQTTRPLLDLDSRTAMAKVKAKDTEATAHNNILHSHSKVTAMVLRPVSVDSRVMVGQPLTTARDRHPPALEVTANKVWNAFFYRIT